MAYKLLLVDDEKDTVETLARRLLKEGYEVVTAYDGEEALRQVAAMDPDVVLLDLMMPKLNGFEVLKEIREKYNTKWRPVVIISGTGDLNAVKKSYTMDADHYLAKPCSIEQVLTAVRTMISLIPLRIQGAQ